MVNIAEYRSQKPTMILKNEKMTDKIEKKVETNCSFNSQVEEGSRKLDLQWEAHTARLKRAVRVVLFL